jgi:hypothetical protein
MRGAQNVRFVFDMGGVLDVRQMGDVGDVMFVKFGQMRQMPEVGGVRHQQSVFQDFEKRFGHRARLPCRRIEQCPRLRKLPQAGDLGQGGRKRPTVASVGRESGR